MRSAGQPLAAAAATVAAAAGTDVDDVAAAAAAGQLGDREPAAVAGAGRADGAGGAGNASAHDDADLLEVNVAAQDVDRVRRGHCSQIYPVVHASVLLSPVAVVVSLAAVRHLLPRLLLLDWPTSC